jgi:hypothetical protein
LNTPYGNRVSVYIKKGPEKVVDNDCFFGKNQPQKSSDLQRKILPE